MCVNFSPPTHRQLLDHFGLDAAGLAWKPDTWQDFPAPIISAAGLLLASYGFVPKRHLPPGVRFTTMNARAETIGEKPTYKGAWRRGQLCLVPMQAFFEPCYESGKAVRTRICRADSEPFAVAGMWREWLELDGGISHAFTQITINADEHPLMKRMHKPGDEKRSLVILPREIHRDWLECREPEMAREMLCPFRGEEFTLS